MNTVTQATEFDAFGEPSVVRSGKVRSTRRARNVAVAAFWSVALVLIAGRVYQNETSVAPHTHSMEIASR